jgi:tRNA(Ile)-lysidine synthase
MKKLEIPTLNIEPISVLPEHFSKGCIYLDADKIKGELKVRLWENKDKLKPIGQQGSKLVSKILNEFHLSAYQKKHVLVVHDEEHIHWIVGYKIGRMAVAGLKTNRIVKVSISENQINSPAEFIV